MFPAWFSPTQSSKLKLKMKVINPSQFRQTEKGSASTGRGEGRKLHLDTKIMSYYC